MIVKGFTPQMLDFLAENHIRNSKVWYDEHKDQCRELVTEPFYQLVEKMAPVMLSIDPSFVVQPSRCLSRVRRDTRFTKNKDLYRDHMWITFRHAKKRLGSSLCYYFGIDQDEWSYGVGYYDMPRDVLAQCQKMILREDKSFVNAYHALESSRFSMYGEDYKRPKFPDAPERYQCWLNKKRLGVNYASTDFDPVFRGEFYDAMMHDIQEIAPFYDFLRRAEQSAHHS